MLNIQKSQINVAGYLSITRIKIIIRLFINILKA